MNHLLNLALAFALISLPGAAETHAEQNPALLRSISTGGFRSTVARSDGTTIAVKKEGVILRDPAGGTRFVRRLRNNQRVVASSDARKFGVATYADNAPSTLHVAKYEFYDSEGTLLWSLSKPQASDFKVSPRGSWVVGVAGADGMLESDLHLFDSTGQQVGTWRVAYLSDLMFPYAGNRFFAASKGELQAFPYDGGPPQSLGRFEHFGTSRDGRWVAVFGAGAVSLFDGTALVFTSKSEQTEVRTIAVSPDGRYLAIAGGDRLELHDREARGAAWAVTSGDPDLRFVSVDLLDTPLRVLCGLDLDKGPSAPAGRRHPGGALFLLDSAGTLTWRDDLSYDTWNFRVPRVEIAPGRKQFDVELASERRQYSLP